MSDPPKTAIVTGASQGIGAGIVHRFVPAANGLA
jgi:NAD(P)-dependent dehydrogenase (short-subunit alcohol dehydrogenase family)